MMASSGCARAGQREQFGAVPGLADDLESRPFEQAGQALAEQDIVIGQHDPGCGRLSGATPAVPDGDGIPRLSATEIAAPSGPGHSPPIS